MGKAAAGGGGRRQQKAKGADRHLDAVEDPVSPNTKVDEDCQGRQERPAEEEPELDRPELAKPLAPVLDEPGDGAGRRREPKSPSQAKGAKRQGVQDQRWRELVAEAAGAEIEAMHLDQEGFSARAAESYRFMTARLLEAAQCVPPDHAVRQMLAQRADEAAGRVAALEESLGAAAGMPLEERVRDVKLTAQGILASRLATVAGSTESPGARAPLDQREDVKVMGVAAAMGGAAGLLLMGPVSAAAMGAAALYTATREDAAGTTVRKVGAAGLGAADRAMGEGLKVAELALEESRRKLLEGLESPSMARPTQFQALVRSHRDQCQRVAAACGKLQEAMPRKRLSEEARRMRTRYPDRVPVICEKAPTSDLPEIENKKFCVPGTMLCGEFKYIVHKQVAKAARQGVANDQTIYVFASGVAPRTGQPMAELYEKHRADDGFLYITYCAENTLG